MLNGRYLGSLWITKKVIPDLHFCLSGRGDLNPRPQRPERCALTKLRYFPVRTSLVKRDGHRVGGKAGVVPGLAAQESADRLA